MGARLSQVFNFLLLICAQQATVDQDELVRLLRENVAYKLKRGKTKEAVAVLEYLHEYVSYYFIEVFILYSANGCSTAG